MSSSLLNRVRGAAGPVTVLLLDHRTQTKLNWGESTEVIDLATTLPVRRHRETVVLATHDRQTLTRAVAAMRDMGTARHFIVHVQRSDGRALTFVPNPEWPPVVSMQSLRSESALLTVTFERAAAAGSVLVEIAKASLGRGLLSAGWPVLGVTPGNGHTWPLGSTTAVADFRGIHSWPDEKVPPDLVFASSVPEPAVGESHSPEPHAVTGRLAEVVVGATPLTWSECQLMRRGELLDRLERGGSLAVGDLDERMVNPIGFDHSDHPVAPLSAFGDVLRVKSSMIDVRMHSALGPTGADLRALRGVGAVGLSWRGGQGPHAYARTVAGLAMGGVPLVSTRPVPRWAWLLLGDDLSQALGTTVDLTNALRREEHSVLVRRLAGRRFGARDWRRSVAGNHRLPGVTSDPVTVLLCSRRPEQLDFAMRQVRRQQGVPVSLIVMTHGFQVGGDVLCDDLPENTVVLSAPANAPFGEVLNRAVAAAETDLVLKMDDDDYYGPNFVEDLVRSRYYSGADLVGAAAEMQFIEPLWLTVRRREATERYGRHLAGGTMLMSRSVLRELGGFRSVHKYVDATLIRSLIDAGGLVYRGQGLGYLLRRGASGHTWDPGVGYFIRGEIVAEQWHGFRPSAVLAADPADAPRRNLPTQAELEAFLA